MDQDAAATDFIIFIIDAVNNGKIKVSGVRDVLQQFRVCLKVDQLMEDQPPDFFKIFEPSHIKALGKAVSLIGSNDTAYGVLPVFCIQVHVKKWLQIQSRRYIAAGLKDYESVMFGPVELFHFFVLHLAAQDLCNLCAGFLCKFLNVHHMCSS